MVTRFVIKLNEIFQDFLSVDDGEMVRLSGADVLGFTLVNQQNLDNTETGEAESYVAVLAHNKVEGVAQVLVFRNSNLQGKERNVAELLRIVNLALGSLTVNFLRGLQNFLATTSRTSSASRSGRSCSFAKEA